MSGGTTGPGGQLVLSHRHLSSVAWHRKAAEAWHRKAAEAIGVGMVVSKFVTDSVVVGTQHQCPALYAS